MPGGIQKGTVAWDEQSLKIDNIVSKSIPILKKEFGYFTFQKKLRKDQVPGRFGACCPDGGIWFRNDIPVVAFEAKKQNNRGNAIERWWKNHSMLRLLNPDISYVTFATGEGAVYDGVIMKALSHAVLENGIPQFNTIRLGRNSIFLSSCPFTSLEIINIMREVLRNS